ncbi:hypothetical protein AAFP35_10065 [Gordonia sp. CPCC 206044]|uniref:hypothetical protein n=1 Tax=Gordonia sp. CPCC 206044 TaxID=3140793 RepID=UPI003AF33BD7
MTTPDLDHRDSINHYLAVCALVADGKACDAHTFIVGLDDDERADMWLAGCSITLAFANDCRQHHHIPDDLPGWLRHMAATNVDDAL